MSNSNFYLVVIIGTVVAATYANPSPNYEARFDYTCDPNPGKSECDQVLQDLKSQALDSIAALGAIDTEKCTQIKIGHGRTETACNVTSQKEPRVPLQSSSVLFCGTVQFRLLYFSKIGDEEHVELTGSIQAELRRYSSSSSSENRQSKKVRELLQSLDTTNLQPGQLTPFPKKLASFFPDSFSNEKLRNLEYSVTVSYYYTQEGACDIEPAPESTSGGAVKSISALVLPILLGLVVTSALM